MNSMFREYFQLRSLKDRPKLWLRSLPVIRGCAPGSWRSSKTTTSGIGSGANPSLGALCREISEIEHAYVESFKTFRLDLGYCNADPRLERSVASPSSPSEQWRRWIG